jgi:hypothetical protein
VPAEPLDVPPAPVVPLELADEQPAAAIEAVAMIAPTASHRFLISVIA